MKTEDLLFEIGCEEIPAKLLSLLAQQLLANITDALNTTQITFGETRWFATPRRLAVLIHDVATQQPEQKIERRGPALAAAYDAQHKPTPALMGFLKSAGINANQLVEEITPKGTWLIYRGVAKGKKTIKLLPDIISNACKKLPIPKPMRWGNHKELFIRPVRWIVLLFGKKVVTATILGKQSKRYTYGHRFMAPGKISIPQPADYEKLLKNQGKVIADFDKRKNEIINKSTAIYENLKFHNRCYYPKIDENLLSEVCGLVEYPIIFEGSFINEFTQVPQEALIAAMQNHQKCFPVLNEKGQFVPYFIIISNIESGNLTQVKHGNERVMRARLSDAKFFYETDSKHKLDYYLEKLKTVSFQKDLGSLYDKSIRVAELAKFIASEDIAEQAYTAGKYCKADLATSMVGEFPELQGIMGYYYAKDNLGTPIAEAIRDHYLPKFAGDNVPTNPLNSAVALADKIDTLVGIFGINQKPTGEKDPFGLRRAAIGVIRIIIENAYEVDLLTILHTTQKLYATFIKNLKVVEETLAFILERLRFYYKEKRVNNSLFEAVAACQQTNLTDFDLRINALEKFLQTAEAASLIAANKRVSNILAKQDLSNIAKNVNKTLLQEAAEKDIWKNVQELMPIIQHECQQKQYEKALTKLAALKEPLDQFFEKVMVMAEDVAVRNNRLALLQIVRDLFLQIADFSLLQN